MRWNVIWIHFAITVQKQVVYEALFVSWRKGGGERRVFIFSVE